MKKPVVIEKDGLKLTVFKDPQPDALRDECSGHFATMACLYHDAKGERPLGDETIPFEDFQELVMAMANADEYVFRPLYMTLEENADGEDIYQLSSSPFSTGKKGRLVGYAYVSVEDVLMDYNVVAITDEIYDDVVLRIEDDIVVYNVYLAGEVYAYEIEGADGQILDAARSIPDADLALDAGRSEFETMLRKRSLERANTDGPMLR